MVASNGTHLQDDARRRSSIDTQPLESEEELVTVRPVEDGDASCREVRISCPDATGLGCDVARMLFDFGLRITEGDISTDGQWCFMVFKVRLSRQVKPHWQLLQQRLKKICPHGAGTLPLWSTPPAAEDFGPPFVLTVASCDRRDFLHDLVNTLWEADVLVFKAHITTSSDGKVQDTFWIHDHRLQLPDTHRVLQIQDMLRECVRQRDVELCIEAAPPQPPGEDSAGALARRCACVDARAFSPLRRLLSQRRQGGGSDVVITQADEFGTPEHIKVGIDNCTTSAYSVVNVVCDDRKGLVYDLTRTVKDIHLRAAYGKVGVRPGGLCEVDLFVQEVDGSRIVDADMQAELVERIRTAVTLPLRIDIKDAEGGALTELLVTAFLDSGGRGRPRVTFDVTVALSSLGFCIREAEIYIDVLRSEYDRPVEIHRFLLHRSDSKSAGSQSEKKLLYTRVKAQLMGTEEARQESAPLPKPNQDSRAAVVLDSLSAWNWTG